MCTDTRRRHHATHSPARRVFVNLMQPPPPFVAWAARRSAPTMRCGAGSPRGKVERRAGGSSARADRRAHGSGGAGGGARDRLRARRRAAGALRALRVDARHAAAAAHPDRLADRPQHERRAGASPRRAPGRGGGRRRLRVRGAARRPAPTRSSPSSSRRARAARRRWSSPSAIAPAVGCGPCAASAASPSWATPSAWPPRWLMPWIGARGKAADVRFGRCARTYARAGGPC